MSLLEQQIRDPYNPSLEWYSAIGIREQGIMRVFVGTERFQQLGNEEVMRCMNDWGHSGGTFDPGEREISSIGQRLIVEAEKYVTLVTGFTPRQIYQYGKLLEHKYRGEMEAPFEVIWRER